MLTQARLKELLSYDPETGAFTWLVNRGGIKAGAKAGCLNDDGYFVISVNNKTYLAHRLAWLYMTGAFPDAFIDHRDRNPSNNSFSNLREATPQQSGANRGARVNNKLGVKGVHYASWLKKPKYVVDITCGGIRRVREFSTLEEAKAAYEANAKELCGEFAAT